MSSELLLCAPDQAGSSRETGGRKGTVLCSRNDDQFELKLVLLKRRLSPACITRRALCQGGVCPYQPCPGLLVALSVTCVSDTVLGTGDVAVMQYMETPALERAFALCPGPHSGASDEK